ncbi:sulfur carrier protein ThiS [Xylophilus ampelinus]|uniref:sulfur carrier protein ThiS n=1 Tax=Xylophilus ampelinus TaxID=54067 RepID=UPI000D7C0047|nr:sulfur carrier protein ThiS [Xylophilus ampelinus]MCS4510940.1 sulfur carrier protein ThiS [Xylophilus ampelinus]
MHDAAATHVPELLDLRLDGHPYAVPAGSSLADLVAAQGHAPEAVASAVNGDFVPRGQRAARRLQAGDTVLLFQPITGG